MGRTRGLFGLVASLVLVSAVALVGVIALGQQTPSTDKSSAQGSDNSNTNTNSNKHRKGKKKGNSNANSNSNM